MNNISLLLDSARGVYIPQNFVESYDAESWHIKHEDAVILLTGINHDYYWETWDSVLSYAYCIENEHKFTLHQDSDLWAVCLDNMSDEEYEEFFY